jgi:exodeoxyribonuclease-3
MLIATWNVNSIRARVNRVVAFLERTGVDVLGMQEIKCKPEQFPYAEFEAIGYKVVAHGLNQWNGVAFAYKAHLDPQDIELEFTQQPSFKDVVEARAIGATFEGVRIWSIYVPNGRALADPHMEYKLEFLDRLAATTAEQLEINPDLEITLLGDFNVAPLDTDVYDLSMFETHISEPERQAFEAFEQIGLTDKVRELLPNAYTYWDYKELCFPKNNGMRIDFVLSSSSLTSRIIGASIEREERKGEGPSDHVPVIIELSN